MDACTLCTLGDEPGCEACSGYVEPDGEPAPSIVYRVVHVPTGRLYVGVHGIDGDPFEDDGYMGSGSWLRAAIDKHGREQFRRDVLAILPTKEAAYELEGGLVGPEQVASRRYFNLCLGGRGVVGPSEESRAKNSASHRELFANDSAFRARHSAGLRSYMASLSEDERREVTAAARTPEAVAKATSTRRERLDGMTPEERRALIAPALAPEAAEIVAAKNRARAAAMTPEEKRASTAHMNTPEVRDKANAARWGPGSHSKASAALKRAWARATPEQRAARTAAAREGQRAAWARKTPEEQERITAAQVEGRRRAKAERERIRREVALIFLALVLDKYGEPGAAA